MQFPPLARLWKLVTDWWTRSSGLRVNIVKTTAPANKPMLAPSSMSCKNILMPEPELSREQFSRAIFGGSHKLDIMATILEHTSDPSSLFYPNQIAEEINERSGAGLDHSFVAGTLKHLEFLGMIERTTPDGRSQKAFYQRTDSPIWKIAETAIEVADLVVTLNRDGDGAGTDPEALDTLLWQEVPIAAEATRESNQAATTQHEAKKVYPGSPIIETPIVRPPVTVADCFKISAVLQGGRLEGDFDNIGPLLTTLSEMTGIEVETLDNARRYMIRQDLATFTVDGRGVKFALTESGNNLFEMQKARLRDRLKAKSEQAG